MIAENRITEYYKGLPCEFSGVYGRIVGESKKGSWGKINGVDMFSIPLFCTPHGTVIEIGVLRLTKINDNSMKKLLELEEEAIKENIIIYNGLLDNI